MHIIGQVSVLGADLSAPWDAERKTRRFLPTWLAPVVPASAVLLTTTWDEYPHVRYAAEVPLFGDRVENTVTIRYVDNDRGALENVRTRASPHRSQRITQVFGLGADELATRKVYTLDITDDASADMRGKRCCAAKGRMLDAARTPAAQRSTPKPRTPCAQGAAHSSQDGR